MVILYGVLYGDFRDFEVAPHKIGNALLLGKYMVALSTPRAAIKAMSARGVEQSDPHQTLGIHMDQF